MADLTHSIIEVATRYVRRGWSVIPVPYRAKNPGFRGWQSLRLAEPDLPARFNGQQQNIGVLLGEPSGWLIDVDLDHPRAVELAASHLPPTPAVFGRAGKPCSHWLYRTSGRIATKKFRSKSAGMLVEVRSTGAQTVVPPSTHESGEAIEWDDETAEPALVSPEELLDSAQELASAVLVELGERSTKRTPKKATPAERATPDPPPEVAVDKRARRCLEAMRRMNMVDHRDGSSRLYAAACRAVEHDLPDSVSLSVIRTYAAEKPFPRAWSDDEILARLRDADRACERGCAVKPQLDDDGLVRLGTRDPASGRLVLSPKKTLPTAEAYVREFHTHPDGRTLHCYAGLLMEWRGNRYVELEVVAAKKRLQLWLHESLRHVHNRNTGETVLVGFESNPATVKAALETILNQVFLPVTVASPSWLIEDDSLPPPEEILPCRTILLHLPTMTHLPSTPAFFTTNALDFDPDPQAPQPAIWQRFLHELFDDDVESQDLLQDWFGYCLTGDTSQQKMMLVVGPRRSGKGTIARVLTRLIGADNVCGPTTSSLAGPFGLQPLIGKTLAIVSDARFAGDNIPTVVERILCITGEDALTVDRKFLPSVTMKLPTRFMFLTNELPRLTDASGALAGRFVILRTLQSFYGREDPQLSEKLVAELPGILNWAVEGWQRLRERGRLDVPRSVEDAVRDIEDLSSPVGAFVRELCDVAPGRRTTVDDLYEAWKRWCESDGRNIVTTKQTFGRDLAAAVPGVTRRRSTGQQPFYEGIILKDRIPCF